MRFLFLTFLFVTLATSSLSAADLTKIPRSIFKEPHYQSKPQYVLLAFGTEAKLRMWLVFDNDLLYWDRNGNGDLTENGEALKPSEKPVEKGFVRVTTYHLPLIQDPFTGKKYEKLTIDRLWLKADYVPKSKEEKERMDLLVKQGSLACIRLWKGEKIHESGTPRCLDQPGKANILHFDGPRTL